MLRPLALAIALAPWACLAHADDEVRLDALSVVGEADNAYQPRQASVSGFSPAPLLDTPAAITVISEQQIQDRQVRILSELLKADASVGDSYAPVGYYENFIVRGFSLSSASSYRINGRTITGEQHVALENKQQVELLKGLAGLQSGVTEPGGLVNYVTKRPEQVRTLGVATNEHGERYLSADLGGWFGDEQQFGLRLNAAHEDIRSYVEHADGTRRFLSLAADWRLAPSTVLQLDIEYQDKEQHSVPGYQLLGGTQVPHDASPRKKLGHQSWSKEVGIESLNTSARLEHRLSDTWQARLELAHSRVVIDDYSSFAWGCYDTVSCPGAFLAAFGSDGTYDIYDYRSPDDTRRNDDLQASLDGLFHTGALKHELTLGSGYFKRLVDRRSSVNEWVGTGNIHGTPVDHPAYEGPLGHTYRRLDSRQKSLFIHDRIHFDERWQLLAGARQVWLDERAFNRTGLTTRHTQRSLTLPQLALLHKPTDHLSLYASYGKGLSLGGEAPWYTSNDGEVLVPTTSQQWEIGIRHDWQRLSLGASLFRTRQALQYTRVNDDGSFTYVQRGRQQNQGLELSANGQASDRLQVSASLAAIRARLEGSGQSSYEGHQALNVPKFRANLQGDYRLPVNGLSLLAGLNHSSGKYANREGTVKVSGYTLLNLGARYRTQVNGYPTTVRLVVDNLTDKRYWRDVGESAGDGYLFLGAPRTARLSAQVDF